MVGTALQNLFTSLATYFYFLVGRILTAEYQFFVAMDHRQSMRKLNRLNRSYRLLNREFGLILLVVVFSCFITTITASYFLIRSLIANQPILVLWDIFQIAENLTKIVVISYTADQQIESVVILF